MEIYFHAKSGASRMKNEGVMTVLVGGTNMIKREGENRVKEKIINFPYRVKKSSGDLLPCAIWCF